MTMDHGALTGLVPDDDHTQYALAGGRAGGQTLKGGTAAGEDLTLSSTGDASKGSLFIGSGSLFEFDETTGLLKLPTTGAGGGLQLGADVRLYRAGADVLMIPDFIDNMEASFTAGGPANAGMMARGARTNITAGDINWSALLAQPVIDKASTGNFATVVSLDVQRVSKGAGNPSVSTAIGARVDQDGPAASLATVIGVDILAIGSGASASIGLRVAAPYGGTSRYALQLPDTGDTPAGGITFGTDTNLYRSAADKLRTDDTLSVGAALGIGTASPAKRLHASDTGEGLLRLERTGAVARRWDINIRPNFVIGDDTGGVDRFTIDTSGNVGIGTASPNWRLTLNHADGPFMNWQLNGVNKAELGVGGGLGASKLGLSNVSSWMTVWDLANGNVGIGTTAPKASLQVGAVTGLFTTSNINTNIANNVYFDGSNFRRIVADNDAPLIQLHSDGYMAFFAPSDAGSAADSIITYAERFRIDKAGNVGMGATAPAAKLDVAGRIAIPNFGAGGAYQARKDDGSLVDLLWVQNDASFQNATRLRSAGGGVAIHSLAGANIMYIAESGAVQVSGQPVINASGQVLYA